VSADPVHRCVGHSWAEPPTIGTEISYYLFRIPRIGQIPALALDLSRRLNAEIEASLENLYGGMELPAKKFRLRIDQGL